MKIDIEVVKNFLTVFHEHDSPLISTLEIIKKLELNNQLNSDKNLVYFYLKILCDQDLIDIESTRFEDKQTLGFTFGHGGIIFLSSRNFRLTNDGHKTLEVMLQSKIWGNVKTQMAMLGTEGLKQIPMLAIEYLKSQFLNPV